MPRRTFYNWLEDPGFLARWNALWEQMVEVHFPGIVAATVHKAQSGRPGSIAAARLIAEMKGVIRKRVEVSGPGGGPVHTVDYAKLNPDQLLAIASLHPDFARRLGGKVVEAEAKQLPADTGERDEDDDR